MKLNRYLNSLLIGAIILTISLGYSLSYFLINSQFNTYLYEEHLVRVTSIKNHIDDMYASQTQDDFNLHLKALETLSNQSGYLILLSDPTTNQQVLVGQSGGRGHMMRGMMGLNQETFTLNLSAGRVVEVTLAFEEDYQSSQAALNFRSQMTLMVVITGLISLLVMIGLANHLTRTIKEPLLRVSTRAKMIEKGNYQAQIPLTGKITEFNDLNTSIEAMSHTLTLQNDLRKRLVSKMSHEIKTPISVLYSQIEAIKDGVITGDQEIISGLLNQIKELTYLVEGLENATAFSDDFTMSQLSDLDVNLLLENLIQRFDTVYKKRQITVDYQYQGSVHLTSDPRKITSIVSNCLMNIYKYAESNSQVSLQAVNQQDHLTLSIENLVPKGYAIDTKYLGQAGYQANRQQDQGQGLGLYIIKQVVSQLDGRVEWSFNVPVFKVEVWIPNKKE